MEHGALRRHPVGDRVQGLGANDAKASVAAMTAAFLALSRDPLPITLGLALVASEETTSQGTRDVLVHLEGAGVPVRGAVFGEPTELDLAVAQKGLLVLELVARGSARHAGHPPCPGEESAVRLLARDLSALAGVDLRPDDPHLGPATLEPTLVRAGTARNVVPAEAVATVDGRTTPALAPAEIVARPARRPGQRGARGLRPSGPKGHSGDERAAARGASRPPRGSPVRLPHPVRLGAAPPLDARDQGGARLLVALPQAGRVRA
jgi:acetylornithine deacetylase/succinyl-diaminopimelate desuccinylase-like protein